MEQLQAVAGTKKGLYLDPRTKLLLMAVVATAEFLYNHTAFMIAVALIPFVLLLTNRQYKTAITFFLSCSLWDWWYSRFKITSNFLWSSI